MVEVTEKYTEVCAQKSSIQDELTILKDNSVRKNEHAKVIIRFKIIVILTQVRLVSEFIILLMTKQRFKCRVIQLVFVTF